MISKWQCAGVAAHALKPLSTVPLKNVYTRCESDMVASYRRVVFAHRHIAELREKITSAKADLESLKAALDSGDIGHLLESRIDLEAKQDTQVKRCSLPGLANAHRHMPLRMS